MFKIDDYVIVKSVELRRFKRSWPAHGIPSDIEAIAFEFDKRGDLVDIEYLTEEPEPDSDWDDRAPIYLDADYYSDMDAAIAALSQDVKEWLFSGKNPEWA